MKSKYIKLFSILIIFAFKSNKKRNMNYFPKDPAMLMSWINLKLRDFYGGLEELCDDLEIDRKEVEEILKQGGFEYNDQLHKVW